MAVPSDSPSPLWQRRGVWLTFGLTFVAMPFAAADFMPLTDMPQHLAQIRLLDEVWGLAPVTVDAHALGVRIFGANTLVYVPLFVLSRVMPLLMAGKLTTLLLLAASVFALQTLAMRRGRDPLHALLAGCLFYNTALYWGFLNFISGVPLFLWFSARVLTRSQTDARLARLWVGSTILALGLLWAHVFWVGAAALVVALAALTGAGRKRSMVQAASLVPALVLALLWFPSLVKTHGGGGGLQYFTSIHERMRGDWLASTLVGGIAAPFSMVVSCVLIAYAALVVTLAFRRRELGIDTSLLTIGIVLALLAISGPDLSMNTLMVSTRFMPYAGMFILLSLPTVASRTLIGPFGTAAALFAITTSLAWSMFEQDDLTGLRESLALVKTHKSVLGLDYRQHSTLFQHYPFLQMPGYFQAQHGGDLSFSFAEHGSSIVAYTQPRRITWTPLLDWFPAQATLHDVNFFDCVLVNGSAEQHETFRQRTGLSTRVAAGYFRIYCHEPG